MRSDNRISIEARGTAFLSQDRGTGIAGMDRGFELKEIGDVSCMRYRIVQRYIFRRDILEGVKIFCWTDVLRNRNYLLKESFKVFRLVTVTIVNENFTFCNIYYILVQCTKNT